MLFSQDEVFGSPDQQTMLRRGRAMFETVRDDPRFTYYGRTVGVAMPSDAGPDVVASLAFLQGASHLAAVPDAQAPGTAAEFAAQGLSVTSYPRWTGGQRALTAARAVIDGNPLPADITPVMIDAAAPSGNLALLADVAALSGVLPPTGSVLRGQLRPGLAMVAVDAGNRPVSCAAAAAFCHPGHPVLAEQAWWGMLSTHPDRRGERIALVLGAMAMIALHDRFGFRAFMTGVQAGNAPSEALCAKLGLAPDGMTTVTVVDPRAIASGKLTS